MEKLDFKQRIRNRKSDAKHPQNSTCREYDVHLRDYGQIETFFQICPFYHEKDHCFRQYKEKRFIIKSKPPLNISET